jgi:hypothetical protein
MPRRTFRSTAHPASGAGSRARAAEIAALLQVHVSTVRDWIHLERLFANQLSERVYRIPLSSLMEMLGETDAVLRRGLSTAESDQIWRDISAEHGSSSAQA